MAANASAGDIYEEYLFKAEALRVLHEPRRVVHHDLPCIGRHIGVPRGRVHRTPVSVSCHATARQLLPVAYSLRAAWTS